MTSTRLACSAVPRTTSSIACMLSRLSADLAGDRRRQRVRALSAAADLGDRLGALPDRATDLAGGQCHLPGRADHLLDQGSQLDGVLLEDLDVLRHDPDFVLPLGAGDGDGGVAERQRVHRLVQPGERPADRGGDLPG